MKIKSKLLLLAPLSVLGMLIVCGIFFSIYYMEEKYRSQITEIENIRALSNTINLKLLEARQAESSFLLYSDETYTKAHAELSEDTSEKMRTLSANISEQFPGELDTTLTEMSAKFSTYTDSFTRLHDEKLRLGLNEKEGLQGALRAAVKSAEKSARAINQAALMEKILMMRRHEKDFIMRVDEKYVGRLQQRIVEFKDFPVFWFGAGGKETFSEISTKLDAYEAAFLRFVESTNSERAIREELSKAYSDLEPVFANVQKFTEDKHNDATGILADLDNILLVIIAGALTLVALVIGLIVFKIGTSIANPITSIVNALNALSSGNNDVQLDGAERKDEIGNIVRSFLEFRDSAVQKIELENEAKIAQAQIEQDKTIREAEKAHEQARLNEAVMTLGEALQRMASGKLDDTIAKEFAAEIDSLRTDFNRSITTLSTTLGEVGNSSEVITEDVNNLKSAADELNTRTVQQAKSLEQTSAALEEITVTVNLSTERAQEASKLMNATKQSTDESDLIVSDAVSAMSRIETASSEISNIINVIDEIAFQTNLLALNAGVEAARAGEAGQGFAVVAQEVRELAQRATNAAKEIKTLITQSGDEVATGVKLVQDTGSALAGIAEKVSTVTQHINSIAEAAAEQSVGLSEINSSVNSLDRVTQENAAMANESSKTTNRLYGNATQLSKIISQFKLLKDRSDQSYEVQETSHLQKTG